MQETEYLELEETSLYSEESLSTLDKMNIPKHIAIIMDGNRRWAIRNGMAPFQGHYQGAKQLDSIVKASIEIGIKRLTVFAFSTENWKRSEKEVAVLMRLLRSQLLEKKEAMKKEGIKLSFIGDMTQLPKRLSLAIRNTVEYTKDGMNFELVIAINYGARNEIVRSARKIADSVVQGHLKLDDIDEKLFESYLDTAHMSHPDLMIRTSGEHRLSNFLLWQLGYSEVFISDMYWPEFSHVHFLNAVLTFQKRHRRYGG